MTEPLNTSGELRSLLFASFERDIVWAYQFVFIRTCEYRSLAVVEMQGDDAGVIFYISISYPDR